jgi:hypothetical protein
MAWYQERDGIRPGRLTDGTSGALLPCRSGYLTVSLSLTEWNPPDRPPYQELERTPFQIDFDPESPPMPVEILLDLPPASLDPLSLVVNKSVLGVLGEARNRGLLSGRQKDPPDP